MQVNVISKYFLYIICSSQCNRLTSYNSTYLLVKSYTKITGYCCIKRKIMIIVSFTRQSLSQCQSIPIIFPKYFLQILISTLSPSRTMRYELNETELEKIIISLLSIRKSFSKFSQTSFGSFLDIVLIFYI